MKVVVETSFRQLLQKLLCLWCTSGSSKAVHKIKLPLIYSEFTGHMQNQLKAGSFVGTKAGLSHYVQFFSYARAMK